VLYFSDYAGAIAYYQRVQVPPAYFEDEGTRGWQIANTRLTLLKGQTGNPQGINAESQPFTRIKTSLCYGLSSLWV
jgi:hypothetical protein